MRSLFLPGCLLSLVVIGSFAAPPPLQSKGQTPEILRIAKQLLPDVITQIQQGATGAALERKSPRFVSISLGKDEYIYSLKDRVFIRCIKGRYELPAWRVCGDFALVRVELMGENMENVSPVMAWYMVYRDRSWRRLLRQEDGVFSRQNYDRVDLPPYAIRCFNLDNQEMLDR